MTVTDDYEAKVRAAKIALAREALVKAQADADADEDGRGYARAFGRLRATVEDLLRLLEQDKG